MPEPWGIGTKASRVSRATVGMGAQAYARARRGDRRDAARRRRTMSPAGRPDVPPKPMTHGPPSRTGRCARSTRESPAEARSTRRLAAVERPCSVLFDIPIELAEPAEMLRTITGWVGTGEHAPGDVRQRARASTSRARCPSCATALRARRPRLLRRLRRAARRHGARRAGPAPHDRRRLDLGPGGAVRGRRAARSTCSAPTRRSPARPPTACAAGTRACDIAGSHHGYFELGSPHNERVIEDINAPTPDIVLVGHGHAASRSSGSTATPTASTPTSSGPSARCSTTSPVACRAPRAGWPTTASNGSSDSRSSRTACGAATCWATRSSSGWWPRRPGVAGATAPPDRRRSGSRRSRAASRSRRRIAAIDLAAARRRRARAAGAAGRARSRPSGCSACRGLRARAAAAARALAPARARCGCCRSAPARPALALTVLGFLARPVQGLAGDRDRGRSGRSAVLARRRPPGARRPRRGGWRGRAIARAARRVSPCCPLFRAGFVTVAPARAGRAPGGRDRGVPPERVRRRRSTPPAGRPRAAGVALEAADLLRAGRRVATLSRARGLRDDLGRSRRSMLALAVRGLLPVARELLRRRPSRRSPAAWGSSGSTAMRAAHRHAPLLQPDVGPLRDAVRARAGAAGGGGARRAPRDAGAARALPRGVRVRVPARAAAAAPAVPRRGAVARAPRAGAAARCTAAGARCCGWCR